RNRWKTVGLGVGALIVSFVMLSFVPVAFFPKEDMSRLNISYELPEGTTLEVTKAKSLEVVEALEKYDGIEKVITAIAATREAKPNKTRLDIVLVDKGERTFTQEELMIRLREDLAPRFAVDGAEFTVSETGGHGGGGRTEPIQFIFKSDDW